MTRTLFLVCALMLSSATGCAIGREQSFGTTSLSLRRASESSSWIALTVHDQRSEVVSGGKHPDFVGLSRGGWGNPFDVTTENDVPLADDFAASIQRGLSQAGYRVTVVSSAPGTPSTQALAKLTQIGANSLLLVEIRHWKSDTYQNTSLDYELEALVTDRQGHSLARAQRKGHDDLGGSVWNPGGHADEAVPAAFKIKLDDLLNDPEIVRALHGSQRPPTS